MAQTWAELTLLAEMPATGNALKFDFQGSILVPLVKERNVLNAHNFLNGERYPLMEITFVQTKGSFAPPRRSVTMHTEQIK